MSSFFHSLKFFFFRNGIFLQLNTGRSLICQTVDSFWNSRTCFNVGMSISRAWYCKTIWNVLSWLQSGDRWVWCHQCRTSWPRKETQMCLVRTFSLSHFTFWGPWHKSHIPTHFFSVASVLLLPCSQKWNWRNEDSSNHSFAYKYGFCYGQGWIHSLTQCDFILPPHSPQYVLHTLWGHLSPSMHCSLFAVWCHPSPTCPALYNMWV